MSEPTPARSTAFSTVLARVVVPVWILAGAIFKLVEATPRNLPKNLFELGTTLERSLGMSLYTYLGVFIAIELAFVGAMLVVPRLARAAAITMLGVFCLVLVGELVTGNFESCGCFGKIPIPPWAMLAVDGGMLVALLMLPSARPKNPAWALPAAAVLAIAGTVATTAVLRGEMSGPGADDTGTPSATDPATQDPGAATAGTPQAADPKPAPPATPFTARGKLPDYYYPELDTWVGQRFLETDFARILHWPEDIEQGRRYIILYSRTCDHCQHLINDHIKDNPPVPTIALAIPESKSGFEESGVLPMQLGGCTNARLPIGCDWLVTPPVVIALEDGIVRCAAEEGEEPACLLWH